LVVKMHGKTYADMPVPPLVDKAPKYERPWEPTPAQPDIDAKQFQLAGEATDAVLKLLYTSDLCSRRWIYQQYDPLGGGDTIIGPGIAIINGGGDAQMVCVP